MVKCKEIISIMEKLAPEHLAESWDNIGLIVGNIESKIKNIMISLDVTLDVIEEAIKKDVDMIISHHPMIFEGIKKVNYHDYMGEMLFKLIKNNIAVYASHTNMDIVNGGLNDILAEKLNLKNLIVLEPTSHKEKEQDYVCDNNLSKTQYTEIGLGRVGELDKDIILETLIQKLKSVLDADHIRYVGDELDIISKVAICTGSGADLLEACVRHKADVYITGDVKYHQAQFAKQMGLNLIDAGHYETENIIVPFLVKHFKKELMHKDVNIFATQSNPNIFKICRDI